MLLFYSGLPSCKYHHWKLGVISEGSTDNIRAAQHSLKWKKICVQLAFSVLSSTMSAKENTEGIEAMLWDRHKLFTADDKLPQALTVLRAYLAVKVRQGTASFQLPVF